MSAVLTYADHDCWGRSGTIEAYREKMAGLASLFLGEADPPTKFLADEHAGFPAVNSPCARADMDARPGRGTHPPGTRKNARVRALAAGLGFEPR